MSEICMQAVREQFYNVKGDLVITAGVPFRIKGTTNMMKVAARAIRANRD